MHAAMQDCNAVRSGNLPLPATDAGYETHLTRTGRFLLLLLLLVLRLGVLRGRSRAGLHFLRHAVLSFPVRSLQDPMACVNVVYGRCYVIDH